MQTYRDLSAKSIIEDHRVVSRNHQPQRVILLGIAHREFEQIEAVVNREILFAPLHVQRIKAGLCIAQRQVEGAGLQYLVRVPGREAQTAAAVDNVFAQTDSQIDHAILGLLVIDGIVVDRAPYPGKRRVIAVAILVAHHLLQDDGHLLLVDDVGGGRHIGLAVGIEYRGVDGFHGIEHQPQHLLLVVESRNHVGRIDAGEGLIVRIFEQARRTHGNRFAHHVEEGQQVGLQLVGELGLEELLQNLFVGYIGERHLIEVVALHKGVEYIGTEHHGLGHRHIHPLDVVEDGVSLDHGVDKGQTTPLTAQRSFADAGKVGVLVETVALEDGHDPPVLHLAVLHDGVEDELPDFGNLAQVGNAARLQRLGHREYGPRIEPARYVVARRVVVERLVGDDVDIVLQVLEILDGDNRFARVGVDKGEVAKTEIFQNRLPQIDRQFLGVLVEERGVQPNGILVVLPLRRLDDERQIGVARAHIGAELDAGLLVFHPGPDKRHIGDDTQHIARVFLVNLHGLLVGTGQHHLGAPPHAQHALVLVQRLGREYLRLLQHKVIEVGQYGGVEPDGVLDQQNELHPHRGDVDLGIHLVFDELDDSHQQVYVAQPAEHVVDTAQVFLGNAPRHLV